MTEEEKERNERHKLMKTTKMIHDQGLSVLCYLRQCHRRHDVGFPSVRSLCDNVSVLLSCKEMPNEIQEQAAALVQRYLKYLVNVLLDELDIFITK